MTKAEIMAIYEKAKQGDAESQYELGKLYTTGNGVKQNEQQAAIWYRKAAAQGYGQAQVRTGGLPAGDRDTQDAKAAPQNNEKQGGAMKFCGNCGAAIKEGDTFCGNCGAKDGVGGSTAKAIVIRFGETEQSRLFSITRKAAYISVALLSVLIVVGVVCAFVYGGSLPITDFSVLLLFLMFTILVMLLLLLSIEKNTRFQKVNNTDSGNGRMR